MLSYGKSVVNLFFCVLYSLSRTFFLFFVGSYTNKLKSRQKKTPIKLIIGVLSLAFIFTLDVFAGMGS